MQFTINFIYLNTFIKLKIIEKHSNNQLKNYFYLHFL